MFRGLIRWLLELLGLRRQRRGPVLPPAPLAYLEVDMANVTLSWVLPAVGPRQRALKHVRIEGRITGAPDTAWAAVADPVAVPETSVRLVDLASGDWQFRGIVVDAADVESQPRQAAVSIGFDAPDPLQEFTAVLE